MSVHRTEIVVVGGGVFGLATSLELARRGRRVALFDRFGSGHPATSSTGASRSIRIAYDDPYYVDLARRALEQWAQLESDTGQTILHLTGQVDLGSPDRLSVLESTVAAAGARLERRSRAQLREVLPELAERGSDGLFHREAGTVIADAGMRALVQAAVACGVEIFAPERVTAIAPGDPCVVTTAHRTVEAEQVVVAAGPWSGELLAALGMDLPLAPAVAQVTFLAAPSMVGRPGIAEWPEPGDVGVYGHPVPGVGYKIAFDAGVEGWQGDVEEWAPSQDEERRIVDWVARELPGAPRQVDYSQRHPWTLTPDSDFVIDRHGPIVLACGCSGHAFKFGPALGQPVADVVDQLPANPLFRSDRPGLRGRVSAAAAIAR